MFDLEIEIEIRLIAQPYLDKTSSKRKRPQGASVLTQRGSRPGPWRGWMHQDTTTNPGVGKLCVRMSKVTPSK